jgi:hypothetical protein
MSFKVKITPPVQRRINSWSVPDSILVEIHLRLKEQLSENPFQYLHRTREPFDGMVYSFKLIDPDNRLCEHFCSFQVVYSQDEETLFVVRAGYSRRVGM